MLRQLTGTEEAVAPGPQLPGPQLPGPQLPGPQLPPAGVTGASHMGMEDRLKDIFRFWGVCCKGCGTNNGVLSKLRSNLLVQLREGVMALLVAVVAVVHASSNSASEESANALSLSAAEVDSPAQPLASLGNNGALILLISTNPGSSTLGL